MSGQGKTLLLSAAIGFLGGRIRDRVGEKWTEGASVRAQSRSCRARTPLSLRTFFMERHCGFRFFHPSVPDALRSISREYRGGFEFISAKQWLPKPREELFADFSSEKNLEALMPAFLRFHVMGKSTEEVEEGTLIDYRLRIRGIPARASWEWMWRVLSASGKTRCPRSSGTDFSSCARKKSSLRDFHGNRIKDPWATIIALHGKRFVMFLYFGKAGEKRNDRYFRILM